MDSERDMKSCKALPWAACNKLNKIWHSTLPNETKIRIFNMLIKPILLYGSETWTLTTHQRKRLDGTYANLLRRVLLNIHWSEHATLEHIYGDITPLSSKVPKKRLTFPGHCHWTTGEVIQCLLPWKPSGPTGYRGLTFPEVLSRGGGSGAQ